MTPLDDVEPRVIAERGAERREFAAEPTGRAGVYRAAVAFPSAGPPRAACSRSCARSSSGCSRHDHAAMERRFDAIVFDNDGLLLDTEHAWTRAETVLFERHGETFTAEHKRELIGTSVVQSAAKVERMLGLPGRGAALMDELHELVMEELLAGVPPRPGALELLAAVRAAGIPVGLASNSTRAFVDRALSVAQLADGHFEVVLSAEDVTRPKPAPDLYLAACEALGAAPERAAALEDSPPGVASARAAGMFVIAVPYFPDSEIEGASLAAGSLADSSVAAALGVLV